MALLWAFSVSAEDINFTINVPSDADKLVCTVQDGYGADPVEHQLQNGDNPFTVVEYAVVRVTPVSPYIIKSATIDNQSQGIYDGYYEVYASKYNVADKTVVITVGDLSTLRTAEFTLNVTGADKVQSMYLLGYNQKVDFVEGTQNLEFDPDVEKQLQITYKDYKHPLYSVTVDGTPVEHGYGNYTVPITPGCNVVVEGNWPDKDVTVNFTYGDGAEGCIKSVKVEDTQVADFNGTSITAKAGQWIYLSSNPGFKIDKITINGDEKDWSYGDYSLMLTDDTTIHLDAHQYGKIAVSIDVDHPENVTVYRGYAYDQDVIQLNEGANTVEVYENNPIISWKANDACFITSVTVESEKFQGPQDYTNRRFFEVQASGDKIIFVTGALVMDKTASIWIDNKESANYYFAMNSSYGHSDVSTNFQSGYNELPFCDQFNPFSLSYSAQNPVINQVYIDGELQIPTYRDEHPGPQNYSAYEFSLNDGSVVKIFLDAEPVECAVTFEVADDVTADPTVVTDIVKTLDSWRDGVTVFAGTQFNITGTAECPVDVEIDGNAVTPLESTNDHQFVVGAASTVKITKNAAAGIFGIGADAVSEPVFNLQGIHVADSLEELPAGIYIRAGKKVVVK